MNHTVRVEGLTKSFGEHYALISLDATFKGGKITALLGPNGAGKSTLMNLLSTLMAPSEGHIYLDERLIGRSQSAVLRRRVGYVGHATMVYDALSAFENLRFFAELYGLERSHLDEFLMQRLDDVGLEEVAHRPAGGFSRGMAQRLTLARALLPDPAVLLLDEPFTGLDQSGIEQAAQLIQIQRDRGAVILLSSHDLSITERLYDETLILSRGRRRFFGAPPVEDSVPLSLHALYQRNIV